jgi:hypothetical protein
MMAKSYQAGGLGMEVRMGKGSLNFAAEEAQREAPLGLARFTLYALGYGAVTALACILIILRH